MEFPVLSWIARLLETELTSFYPFDYDSSFLVHNCGVLSLGR